MAGGSSSPLHRPSPRREVDPPSTSLAHPIDYWLGQQLSIYLRTAKHPQENRYIRRLKELFVKYSVESDKEKIRFLGAHTDACSEKEWGAMASFEGNNFDEHKKERNH